MATSTYDLLGSAVLTSPTASVSFTSLSQSYRDLVIVYQNGNYNTISPYFRWNGSSSGYNIVWMRGSSSSNSSSTTTSTHAYAVTTGLFAYGSVIIHLNDYNQTNKHKTALIGAGDDQAYVTAVASRWASTDAITSVTVSGSATLPSGTRIFIYGIVG